MRLWRRPGAPRSTDVVIAAATFFSALILTPLVRAAALSLNILDIPNERSAHSVPVPRPGGIAIVAASAIGLLLQVAITRSAPVVFFFAGVAMALLGAIDDFRPLRARSKFAGQVVIAGACLAVTLLPHRDAVPLLVAFPLALVWVVGFTNAYNFMDGANGIASVQAIVGGITLALLFYRQGDHDAALLSLIVCASAAGFIPWNFPEARIFMGDSGSGFFGCLFGLLSLRLALGPSGPIPAVLVFTPFLFDTSVTVIRRMFRGERSIWTAHKSHFYQLLMAFTSSHVKVVLTYGALALCSGGVAFYFDRLSAAARLISVIALLLLHAVTSLTIYRMWARHQSAQQV